MNTDVIAECTNKALGGQITFPEVLRKLTDAGVERYIVDLVGRQKHSYGIEGEFHSASLELQDMPPISKTLDGASVKMALTEIQQQKIDYVTFLRKIMQAGCCHYEVYISGHQTVYMGRAGGQYIEVFPSMKDAPALNKM